MSRQMLMAMASRAEAAMGGLLGGERAKQLLAEARDFIDPSPSPFREPRQANGEPWGGDGLGPYTPEASAWMERSKQWKAYLDAGALIDAAKSLIPQGIYSQRSGSGGGLGEGEGFCQIWIEAGPSSIFSIARNEALAILASALKARAEMEQ